MELAVQQVFGNMLGILRMSGTTVVVVFHGRAYIFSPADAQYPLVIDMDAVVVAKVVVEPSVAFIRAFRMDLLKPASQIFIFRFPAALLSRRPFVVGRTGYMKQRTSRFDGIPFFLMALLNCRVNMALPYL